MVRRRRPPSRIPWLGCWVGLERWITMEECYVPDRRCRRRSQRALEMVRPVLSLISQRVMSLIWYLVLTAWITTASVHEFSESSSSSYAERSSYPSRMGGRCWYGRRWIDWGGRSGALPLLAFVLARYGGVELVEGTPLLADVLGGSCWSWGSPYRLC